MKFLTSGLALLPLLLVMPPALADLAKMTVLNQVYAARWPATLPTAPPA